MNLARMLLVLGLFAPTPFAQTTVWVVDEAGGAGSDFTDLQPGVDAAADGDVLLVRAGNYDGFTITAKSLTVQADVGGIVYVNEGLPGSVDSVEVHSLTADQVVTIRGLRLKTVDHRGFALFDSHGTIWVEDCMVTRLAETADGSDSEGMYVQGCDSVVLVKTILRGGSGLPFDSTGPPGRALDSVNSEIHLFGCNMYGGDGGANYQTAYEYSFSGADGVRTSGGFYFFSNCYASGGRGEAAWDNDTGVCMYGGDGGHGVALADGSEARAIDCTAVGGHGARWVNCGQGDDGSPVHTTGGSNLDTLVGEAVNCTSSAAKREGDTVVFVAQGPALAPVWLAIGDAPFTQYQPLMNGSFLVALPYVHLDSGILDGTGFAQWSFPIPSDFVLGTDALLFYSQAAVLDPARGLYLGEGTATVLLDSSF